MAERNIVANLCSYLGTLLYAEPTANPVVLAGLIVVPGAAMLSAEARARRTALFGGAGFVIMLGPALPELIAKFCATRGPELFLGFEGAQATDATGEIERTTSSTRNVYLDGHGHLVLKAIRSGSTWTSARIESTRDDFAAPTTGVEQDSRQCAGRAIRRGRHRRGLSCLSSIRGGAAYKCRTPRYDSYWRKQDVLLARSAY